ncbi:MAG TPA: hypothetical protein VJR89_13715, partial [Polyangiales bacterium]|nr:hypothetical protein [Polyangiales bacterium]
MGSRTRVSRRVWAVSGLLLACAGASGCVLGGDSDRPVLAVDLYWDSDPSDHYRPDSCDDADVEYMSWEIKDKKGKSLAKSDPDLEDCQQLDFVGLSPGNYQLEVHGYDRDKQERWAS